MNRVGCPGRFESGRGKFGRASDFSPRGRGNLAHVVWIAAGLLAVLPEGVRAERWPEYQLQGSFQLPVGADVFDVLGDGRIVALVNDSVYVENEVRSRTFGLHGMLPDAPPLDFPSFVRVSPNGLLMAVGDGAGQVGVFNIVPLTGRWISAAHYDAEWFDNRYLVLTGGVGGSVSVLDTQSPDAMNPVNPTIIVNKGIPGGIAFDSDHNLFTGNGFSDSGPIQTGDIKRFARAAWMEAWTGGTPLNFISDGTLVVNVLSAASLGFDPRGNLYAGGGDFLAGTELDFAAVVRSGSLLDAAGGNGPVDVENPDDVQRLDPDAPNDFDFYSVTFNPVTRELYVQNFGESTAYAYVNVAIVPTASAWGLLAFTLLLVTSGSVMLRCEPRSRLISRRLVA